MRVGLLPAILLAAGLAGCANLLPRGSSEQPSAFPTYEAAAQAFERAVPYQTRVEQLREFGFDVNASPNVTRIPYPQLTARLSPDPGVPFEALDPGVRDCILARQGCVAYEFHLHREERRREGSFFLDFLNFRRVSHVVGWRFEGLLAVRDGVVLFRSHAGEAHIDRTERDVNPLGPLQPAGESVGGVVTR